MSRAFSVAGDNLTNAAAAVTVMPATGFSMSLWIKPTVGTTQNLMTLGAAAAANNQWTLVLTAAGAGQILVRDNVASNTTVSSAANATSGVWNLITGTFTDDTNRAIYLNGANKATTAVLKPITAPTNTRISGNPVATSPILSSGLVAHIAIWNTVLSDSDVLALYTNVPSSVQVSSLLEYWPLTGNVSPEPSTGTLANSLTVTGTVFNTDDPFGFPPLLMGQAIF